MRIVDEVAIEAAFAQLAPTPRVVASGNLATPLELVRILDATIPSYRLFLLNAQLPLPDRVGVIIETPFVGPGVRDNPERVAYVPMRLSLVPRLFSSTHPPDAVLVHTSPPRDGRLSLGIEVNILPSALDAVRRRGGLIVAQLNSSMPFTGGDAELDVDDVDLAFEVSTPLPVRPPSKHHESADEIGARAASYATDGATLQVGIGAIPDAVTHSLRGRRGLGVWSEMISDGVLALERAGALDDRRALCASFLFGSYELYAWADRNPRLVLARTERVNDPARIAAHPGMLAINGAIEVDLYAQSNASHCNARVYSGFGGQPDFVSGALHSDGGHAIIVLDSWHEPTNASKIIPLLGSPATSFQHSVVVTEHGAAEIFGQDQREQARRLTAFAADPRARPALEAAAAGMFSTSPAP